MVEFALVLPIMLALSVGLIELGRALVFGVSVQEGARQAARLAASASYDATVDDAAVLGRLVAASNPALAGCASVTTSQVCNGGTWTFSTSATASTGTTYATLATARAANALPGAMVTITAAGSVALLPGLQTGLLGLGLGQITVQGPAAMVVL